MCWGVALQLKEKDLHVLRSQAGQKELGALGVERLVGF